jgi:quercetin dioxygenase-like cupin family protein
MAQADAPTMPSKVTDDVIASVDLKNYGAPGRTLRTRRLVVQPGGIVPMHAHDQRPANIYVVQGQITEYRSTCAVPILHKKGDVTAEAGNLTHWWRNESRSKAVLISADVLPPQGKPDEAM